MSEREREYVNVLLNREDVDEMKIVFWIRLDDENVAEFWKKDEESFEKEEQI